MKKVGFITLGCKVNIYESNALKCELTDRGYIVGEADSDCDCFIINTCSVTNTADSKSRKMIHKCIKMNPSAIICVMGCYAQTNDEAKEIDGIDILIGNGNKKSVVDTIDSMLSGNRKEKRIDILNILEATEYEKLGVTSYDHTRAFVKIEDGCENFCTYCIIPYARGPVRCKPIDEVIEELKRITEEGYLEVVLSGIHTGRYKDHDVNFSGLVKRILNEVPKLKRLRVSSIEMNEVDDEFIALMKDHKVIANHLHLPLQAGSDLILSKMERKYDVKAYIDKVNALRGARPDISITTDVIVGFPYEGEAEFMETYNLCKNLGLSKLHVFPYSMRKGTKASLMPQVKDSEKKDRAKRLIELSNYLEEEYAKKFIGCTLDIIPEQETLGGMMMGHTSNFLQVFMPKDLDKIGKLYNVKITKIENGKIYGEIL
ncbi:MAG: tRNA (N(6)-L-threonylcarbamoyladenosine(37)-C(2))-methylthiotransferase MtaB [Acholeplasmatales bacterium]|nr:tRNA (N(6)-L-threonylcarbamoyladenosine(37)-C(2))-methylthiotransferase MtaB [Acholeplasmatales bacterium]